METNQPVQPAQPSIMDQLAAAANGLMQLSALKLGPIAQESGGCGEFTDSTDSKVQFYSAVPRKNSGNRKETLITIRYSPQSGPEELGRLLISARAKIRYGLRPAGNLIGISATHLMELEQGFCAPTLETAIKISDAYGIGLLSLASALLIQNARQGKREKRVVPTERKQKRWQVDLETFKQKGE